MNLENELRFNIDSKKKNVTKKIYQSVEILQVED